MITYLEHQSIDKERWDNCIRFSGNKIIYALSWYLDIICPNWDALIMDDYLVVMPLPWRIKFGIRYIFKPVYIQYLGLFGANLTNEIINDFINHIPPKFKLADINVNEDNKIIPDKYIVKENLNYKLRIDRPYKDIQSGYNRNAKRNLNKSKVANLSFGNEISLVEFSNFVKENLEGQIKNFKSKDILLLQYITSEILNRKFGEIVCLRDETGTLQAVGSFLFSFDRIIFSVCASSNEGKKNQAMYMLVDEQIKKYADKYIWFDFSGSNLPGVAYFNSTFSALPVKYYSLRIIKLPKIAKVFIKN